MLRGKVVVNVVVETERVFLLLSVFRGTGFIFILLERRVGSRRAASLTLLEHANECLPTK